MWFMRDSVLPSSILIYHECIAAIYLQKITHMDQLCHTDRLHGMYNCKVQLENCRSGDSGEASCQTSRLQSDPGCGMRHHCRLESLDHDTGVESESFAITSYSLAKLWIGQGKKCGKIMKISVRNALLHFGRWTGKASMHSLFGFFIEVSRFPNY